MRGHAISLPALAAVAFMMLVFAPGCVKRSLVIHSNPEGAVVYINEKKMGVTPLKYDFVHYGYFGIRLEKEGFHPFSVEEPVAAPLYEKPGADLVSEAMIPATITDKRELHYELQKIDGVDNASDVISRARATRDRVADVASKRKLSENTEDSPLNPLPLKKAARDKDEKRRKAAESAEGDAGATSAAAPEKANR